MRVSIVAVLLACAVLPAVAAEEGASRSVGQPEMPVVGRGVAKSAILATQDNLPDLPARVPMSGLKPGRSCGASEFEVCLDSSGRISVPGAKRFLPEVPGLKPERLTVKRSGVVLSYSF
ncbi:MAG: hypothetical protein FIB05_02695 [Betaproteobacteria bacterium]|nr:hypothetical protein [Betaproteobacteria bacterium]